MIACEDVQIERALTLLRLAQTEEIRSVQFTLEIAALHLARAIPDYWYTTARLVAQAANLPGSETKQLIDRLSSDLENIFMKARHYRMLDGLRRWDFHWEPLHDPQITNADDIYRRGAPMTLSTGPNPNSTAGIIGLETYFTGSGHRVGRANYYEIQQRAFSDEDSSQVVSLGLAILRFLEDVPRCRVEALAIPEITAYFEHPMRRPLTGPNGFPRSNNDA